MLSLSKYEGLRSVSPFMRSLVLVTSEANPSPARRMSSTEYVLAAQVEGTLTGTAPKEDGEDNPPAGKVNVVFVADVDMMSDRLFSMRVQGQGMIQLDNATLVLNLIDSLAGDSSFVELRKRRVKHRTLTAMEDEVEKFEDERREEVTKAETRATGQLADMRQRVMQAVGDLDKRTDLDERQKALQKRQLQDDANRRINVAQKNIEDEKEREIRMARHRMEQKLNGIRSRIRWLAVLLPPIPALALAIFVFGARRRRERMSR